MSAMKTNGTSRKVTLFSQVKYEHMVAGISGGVTSTLILHPLDLIKIRFAVNDGRTTTAPQYRGLTSAFITIFRQEGFRGLYKGVTPNVWGSGSAWGFYFMFYNSIKTWIQGGNATQPLGPAWHMVAAAEAGILTLVMTNPIWVVKTRLCLQYDGMPVKNSQSKYGGMFDGLVKIYRNEGVKGLYRGFVPGMFGVSHGALQFMTYEEMKNKYNEYRNVPINTKLATGEYLVFAAISKLIAAAATYPYQVIRARLQDQNHSYKGSWDCIKQTWRFLFCLAYKCLIDHSEIYFHVPSYYFLQGWKQCVSILTLFFVLSHLAKRFFQTFENWRGFYKGLVPNLLRVTPATMITLVTYEHVSHYMLTK